MDRKERIRYGIPLILAIGIVTVILLFGVASQNPDGFEWALFDFAGVAEPEGGFEGIWSFLGEGAGVEIFTGITGIAIILLLGYSFFRLAARKTE
ncbi:MAG: hypothetical protein ACTSSE_01760 [Candidatus Thorarchaeota archaeon]